MRRDARYRLRAALIASLACCTWVGAAAGQERRDTVPRDSAVVPLDAVVVTTTRAVTTTGGSSAVLANPDSLHIGSAPTLEQVLRQLPFVQVRENSRGEAELSLRGSESRQVAVLVDGVPLTLGWDHRTDPSVVPVTGAQSIVLVRGLHSVLYGPNVLGGVVEVGVAHGPPPLEAAPMFRVRAGVDHVGGRAVGVTGSAPIQLGAGDLLVRAGAGYRARPGFALPSGLTGLGEDRSLRTNSDLRHTDGFLALRYQGNGGEWAGLSASGYGAERGVPPELHVVEPRLWRYPAASRMLVVTSAGTGHRRTALGTGDLEASIGIDWGSTEIESFGTLAYDRVEATESSDDRTLTVRLLGDHTLGRFAWLRGALTLADVSHDESIDGGTAVGYRQRLWSAATEVTAPLFRGVRASGGFAFDGADTPESGDKPPLGQLGAWGGRLGVSGLAAGGAVRLHAAASRRARFPSLRELYSGSLGRFVPNPDLEPERLLGLEAGLTTQRGGIELQGVAFHHRLSDAIVRASAGERRFRRENRDQIRSSGFELLADWRRGGVSLLGDLMLQNVRVIDPSVPEGERRPEHQPEIRGGLNLTVPLFSGVRGFGSTKYTGRQWCVHPDQNRDVALDPSLRGDAGIERAWQMRTRRNDEFGLLRTVHTSLALENVADAEVNDQCGLPQPGRTLRFQIEVS